MVIAAKSNIRSKVSPIRGCCVENVNVNVGNISRSYRRTDPAEVITIKQIGIAIFTHRNDQIGRCRARHVHQQWTGTTEILVVIVEVEPIERRPEIAKGQIRLKANDCFAATPASSSVDSVTGGNDRIDAVTGNAADAPYTAAVYTVVVAGSPCCYAGWIIYWHAHEPAMPEIAILDTAIPDINNVARNAQRRSLLLNLRSEVMPWYVTVPTSTGQPGFMLPVSTSSDKMRCFLVVPPSGVIIASKKSAREARSMTGVPVIPMGSNLGGQARSPDGTGGPTFLFPDNAAVVRRRARTHYSIRSPQ